MADHSLLLTDEFVDWRGFLARPDNIPLPRPGVYRLLHITNGKNYVGISQNVEHRLGRHAMGMSPIKLRNAIKKYGKQWFMIEPLYYSTITKDTTLLIIEAEFIIEFDSIEHGYNIQAASRGIGPYGPAFSERMRLAWINTEFRSKRKKTDADPTFKARHSEATRAAMALPEIAARMVAASKAKAADPDFRARVSETLKKVHLREDSPFLAFYQDAGFQARRMAAVRTALQRQEVRETVVNRSARKDSRSGIRGVRPTRNGRRFEAYIVIDRKYQTLGVFDTLEEAREAYCVAARRIHGDLFKG